MSQQTPSPRSSPKMSNRILSSIVGAKTDIKIVLQSKRKVYSTLDRIQGFVTVTPLGDVPFDDIDIDFVGTSRTYVERLTTAAAVSGRSQAFHQFLRLSQPGVAQYYPADQILRAGQEYKIPFVFVVPQQLLPRACSHHVTIDAVKDAHVQLPPSMGDYEGSKKQDDYAPEMASIRYGVYTKISKLAGGKRTTVVAKARKVRILPATDEQPPMTVDGNEDFSLRKEKKLRKGLLKGRLGTLVMEAEQPSSFRTAAPDSTDTDHVTTMATVLLRFDPAEPNAQPPRLSNLQAKLKVNTFYSTSAKKTFPSRADAFNEMSAGFHSETVDLSSRCMANVDWTLYDPSGAAQDQLRRSSSTVLGPLVPPSPSVNYANGSFYAARIIVPLDLPQGKVWPPTFHSCLISRTYMLALHLGTHTAPSLSGNLDLRIPVQISSSPSLRQEDGRPSITGSLASDIAADESEEENELGVDEFFEPRTITVPENEYLGGSRLRGSVASDDQGLEDEPAAVTRRDSVVTGDNELPEYSFFAPGSRRVGVPAF